MDVAGCILLHRLATFRYTTNIQLNPMQIKVTREIFNPTCTLGKMYVNDVFFANTLEDTYRDLNGNPDKKVQNDTCIDNGTYKVIVDHSAHFGKDLPHVLNVPLFEGIRIHGGNTAADTAGCILIGSNSDGVGKIWGCAEKVQEITNLICNAGECTITIEGSGGSVA